MVGKLPIVGTHAPIWFGCQYTRDRSLYIILGNVSVGGGDVCMGDLLVGDAQICTNVMGGRVASTFAPNKFQKLKKLSHDHM